MSVLLAEGNPAHRRFARQLFEQHFPDAGPVLEVADGASAVQMALTERPDLLLVDMDLPGVHWTKGRRTAFTSGSQVWQRLCMPPVSRRRLAWAERIFWY
jgi:CheY-like chemotaxis protein